MNGYMTTQAPTPASEAAYSAGAVLAFVAAIFVVAMTLTCLTEAWCMSRRHNLPFWKCLQITLVASWVIFRHPLTCTEYVVMVESLEYKRIVAPPDKNSQTDVASQVEED